MCSVHYSGWNARFDEWVPESMLLAATPENYLASTDLYRDAVADRVILPASFFVSDEGHMLHAALFLHHPHRSRAERPPLRITDDDILQKVRKGARDATEEGAAVDEVRCTTFPGSPHRGTVVQLRAALLYIEAALPTGSVNKSVWTETRAKKWSWNVRHCREDPTALMELMVVLEGCIRPEWIVKSAVPTLRSVSSSGQSALALATFSALALRIWLLDGSLQYDLVQIGSSSAFLLEPTKPADRLAALRKLGQNKKPRGRPTATRPVAPTAAPPPVATVEKRGRGRPRKERDVAD